MHFTHTLHIWTNICSDFACFEMLLGLVNSGLEHLKESKAVFLFKDSVSSIELQ